MNVRVRFAPSPTGLVHIGSLRTALYNWLFARAHGGSCILRIEDTDRSRYMEGAVENLLQALAWCGLTFDEGPSLDPSSGVNEKGSYGPYFQSQRLHLYQKYIAQLVATGHAYYCHCSSARLESLRKSQQESGIPTRYDRHCRDLPLGPAPGAVIRLKVPLSGAVSFQDRLKGTVTVACAEIDDQVLLKSDGFPTYHAAVVIDDHLMDITHVIRGDEWLISTPKHILLYHNFGWPVPEYIHLPLILAPDKSKLSKRMGSVSVEEFRTEGFLPQALTNFVSLLGWNPGDDREIFGNDPQGMNPAKTVLDSLSEVFSIERLQTSPAIFDRTKLEWMNGSYIRMLSPEALAIACIPFLSAAGLMTPHGPAEINSPDAEDLNAASFTLRNGITVHFDYICGAVATEQARIKKLSDIGESTEYFFNEPAYDASLLVWKKSNIEQTRSALSRLVAALQSPQGAHAFRIPGPNFTLDPWTKDNIEKYIKELIQLNQFDTGSILWPLRVALSGKMNSPGPFDIAAVLGKNKTLQRLQIALNMV